MVKLGPVKLPKPELLMDRTIVKALDVFIILI